METVEISKENAYSIYMTLIQAIRIINRRKYSVPNKIPATNKLHKVQKEILDKYENIQNFGKLIINGIEKGTSSAKIDINDLIIIDLFLTDVKSYMDIFLIEMAPAKAKLDGYVAKVLKINQSMKKYLELEFDETEINEVIPRRKQESPNYWYEIYILISKFKEMNGHTLLLLKNLGTRILP